MLGVAGGDGQEPILAVHLLEDGLAVVPHDDIGAFICAEGQEGVAVDVHRVHAFATEDHVVAVADQDIIVAAHVRVPGSRQGRSAVHAIGLVEGHFVGQQPVLGVVGPHAVALSVSEAEAGHELAGLVPVVDPAAVGEDDVSAAAGLERIVAGAPEEDDGRDGGGGLDDVVSVFRIDHELAVGRAVQRGGYRIVTLAGVDDGQGPVAIVPRHGALDGYLIIARAKEQFEDLEVVVGDVPLHTEAGELGLRQRSGVVLDAVVVIHVEGIDLFFLVGEEVRAGVGDGELARGRGQVGHVPGLVHGEDGVDAVLDRGLDEAELTLARAFADLDAVLSQVIISGHVSGQDGEGHVRCRLHLAVGVHEVGLAGEAQRVGAEYRQGAFAAVAADIERAADAGDGVQRRGEGLGVVAVHERIINGADDDGLRDVPVARGEDQLGHADAHLHLLLDQPLTGGLGHFRRHGHRDVGSRLAGEDHGVGIRMAAFGDVGRAVGLRDEDARSVVVAHAHKELVHAQAVVAGNLVVVGHLNVTGDGLRVAFTIHEDDSLPFHLEAVHVPLHAVHGDRDAVPVRRDACQRHGGAGFLQVEAIRRLGESALVGAGELELDGADLEAFDDRVVHRGDGDGLGHVPVRGGEGQDVRAIVKRGDRRVRRHGHGNVCAGLARQANLEGIREASFAHGRVTVGLGDHHARGVIVNDFHVHDVDGQQVVAFDLILAGRVRQHAPVGGEGQRGRGVRFNDLHLAEAGAVHDLDRRPAEAIASRREGGRAVREGIRRAGSRGAGYRVVADDAVADGGDFRSFASLVVDRDHADFLRHVPIVRGESQHGGGGHGLSQADVKGIVAGGMAILAEDAAGGPVVVVGADRDVVVARGGNLVFEIRVVFVRGAGPAGAGITVIIGAQEDPVLVEEVKLRVHRVAAALLAVVDVQDEDVPLSQVETIEVHVIIQGTDLAVDAEPREGGVAHVGLGFVIAEIGPGNGLGVLQAVAGFG